MALLYCALFSSCIDHEEEAASSPVTTGTGELILFRSGCSSTTTTTRADAKTYYMPETSRFVCRMYYKTQEGMEEFDVSAPTDAWLVVNNSTGNSVYWNKAYANAASLDTHGNDNGDDVAYFYWQNRRPHAFLAWTDYNRMQDENFKYSTELESGMLKFSPYDDIITTNEVSNIWMDTGYQLYGLQDDEGNDLKFSNWADLKDYVETHGESNDFKQAQQFAGSEDFSTSSYYYEYGWSCKYYVANNALEEVDASGTKRTSGWIKYLMYYEKFIYEPTGSETEEKDPKTDRPAFLKDALGNYLAVIEYDADDETLEHPHYYKTDINGNIRYDEEKPKFTFYMKRTSELKKDMVVQSQLRANVFDLTRGERTKMTEQPDILQALSTQAPTSATLQANRVDLYFKHQFSQVQVNLKNSEDNSVELQPEQILKVELLGISERGYVFTELERNGTVRASTYKDVVATDYTDAQLTENPYGTSFDMFERTLTDDEKETTGAIKSFEAIAFGLLQAIRITWKETESEGGTVHNATYRVPETNEQAQPLRALQSGVKYIWNIELRRGTLAVVRTEIIPWVLNEENYQADGYIEK